MSLDRGSILPSAPRMGSPGLLLGWGAAVPGSSPSSPLCTSTWQHRRICDPLVLLGAMGSGVQIPPVFPGTVLPGLPHAAGSVGSNTHSWICLQRALGKFCAQVCPQAPGARGSLSHTPSRGSVPLPWQCQGGAADPELSKRPAGEGNASFPSSRAPTSSMSDSLEPLV